MLRFSLASREEDIIEQHQEYVSQHLYECGVEEVPPIPETNRPVEELFEDEDVWNMSLSERESLYNAWYIAASEAIRHWQVKEFENLRGQHAEALKKFQQIQDQVIVVIFQR